MNNPVREAYRTHHANCQFPRCHKVGAEVHEITRGGLRQTSLDQPACLLVLCRAHHDEIHADPKKYDLAGQLAIKRAASCGTYNLQTIRLVYATVGRWAVKVVEGDVDAAAERLGLK